MDAWEGKEDQREKKGRDEDDRNLFLDRYTFGGWEKTERGRRRGRIRMCSFWQVNFYTDNMGTS